MRSHLLSESAKLDESMLDALGILPQRKQHKKLLLKALVGEDSGEEQLFASKNYTSKDGSDGELNVYLQRLKIIKRANESECDPLELSAEFCQEFLTDMADLQCLPHTVQPRVSDHMSNKKLQQQSNKYVEAALNSATVVLPYLVPARIEVDRLLAKKLQEEEREKFTIEERAKFLHDTIAAQRKFLAQQRSKAIRNRPPTKNQLRNQMMTYLKHVGNFKHSNLKTKKFEKIQALYEKIKRSDEDFISIGSAEDERLIKEMNEKGIDSSKNESVKEEDKEEEGTKKRKGGHIKMIARKKKRSQSDVDSDDEHKKCLKIVTFESILDSEIMEKKSVIARLNKVSAPDGDYLVIYRANGNFRAFNYLMEKEMNKVTSGVVNKIGRLSYGGCMNLVEMLDPGLEVERETFVALNLIRFIKQQIDEE
ncbi:retrovirus-related pol polyprotein from transposon TNT 1-94 [Tanacetum coccineum]|uniref:Retrovirus-related pol polyprotein from transposon TNT 1-94 n=1 Tax=Tanacetum coccineum TaxID=301880 RepID=A0ABQ5IMB3_9ASTR